MEELTELDRRIVAALQLDGRCSWAEVARLAGTTESTAARRGGKLLEDGTVRVVGVADPLVCGLGQPVLVQLNCAPGAVRSVVDVLAARSDTRFLALSTGNWDIITEIIVPSRQVLVQALVDEVGGLAGVHRTSSALVTRNFAMRHDWSRDLLDAAPTAVPSSADALADPVEPCVLDDVDRNLLAALADDGRRQFRDLAKGLTVGETGVRRRIERLVASRALVFSTLVSPAALGFQVELFASLKVDLAQLDEVARLLAERTEVRYVSATAGAADLVCEVILARPADIYSFTTGVLGGLPGVRSVEIGLELENHKRAYRPFEI
ncbi:DNA-binding Lrp family transcriptional regulator [Tamaricihabitans halophyticus]|uniref:DNA-binding Lrp family transcriptional regulator n=1 Tax=Tamaricihabitans halophyticus TaxID=1262583 RepID=A0A4R2QLF1_9PSEU|nr:Lrp/AsnC family transcriptional regulator [Tamaricihabitans halophyticus]TCP47861.1 DNA-binding Lrp family transcriptional regulator [Tamaricihabitans halophyticus]